MLQSSCLLRIGVSHVHGSWLPGSSGRAAAAMARFESDRPEPGQSLGEALSAVLDKILPQRRLMAPTVSVGLADSQLRTAVVIYPKLPKTQQDRALVIAQRFCRDHRLDPASFAVLGSALGRAKGGGEAVLCVAVPQALLAQISAPLAAKGLHPDVIAPDSMLSFAEIDTREIESPGILLMQRPDSSTILVWDQQRTIVHIAAIASGPEEAHAGRRTASRIYRYARIVGAEDTYVAFYADGPVPDELASAQAPSGFGLKLLPWPTGHGHWSKQIAAAGL
jgi:hypothetical protein